MKAFKNPYFIYTGNSYPHKNLERAIKAIVLLNKDLKENSNSKSDNKILFLISASRNVFTQRLQKIIKNLKAEDFVHLLGFVPDADLKVLYKNSIGFLFPSISEGFGLPGLEAMKAGTLALVSKIAVFEEIYENNALYFDAYNVESIAKVMKRALLMDKKQREKLIKKAQKFVKKYSWKKMAKETLQVYTNL